MTTLTHHKKAVRAVQMHPKEFSFVSAAADNMKKWQVREDIRPLFPSAIIGSNRFGPMCKFRRGGRCVPHAPGTANARAIDRTFQ